MLPLHHRILRMADLVLASAALMTVALAPAASRAQTAPKYILQNSEVFAFDNTIKAYRVPVIGSDGKIQNYDVTVQLKLNSLGVPDTTTAVITAARSQYVPTGVLSPGRYHASDGSVCTVRNLVLNGGRIQSFLSCTATGGDKPELSVATGPVSSGHPYLDVLVQAGIDKRTDVNSQTWGVVTGGGRTSFANCGYFSTGSPIGTKTDGSLLILSLYFSSNFHCSAEFLKQ